MVYFNHYNAIQYDGTNGASVVTFMAGAEGLSWALAAEGGGSATIEGSRPGEGLERTVVIRTGEWLTTRLNMNLINGQTQITPLGPWTDAQFIDAFTEVV